jgi:hypothetical protein
LQEKNKRQQLEEDLKKMFLRNITTMNFEALSLFQSSHESVTIDNENIENLNYINNNKSNNIDHYLQQKDHIIENNKNLKLQQQSILASRGGERDESYINTSNDYDNNEIHPRPSFTQQQQQQQYLLLNKFANKNIKHINKKIISPLSTFSNNNNNNTTINTSFLSKNNNSTHTRDEQTFNNNNVVYAQKLTSTEAITNNNNNNNNSNNSTLNFQLKTHSNVLFENIPIPMQQQPMYLKSTQNSSSRSLLSNNTKNN